MDIGMVTLRIVGIASHLLMHVLLIFLAKFIKDDGLVRGSRCFASHFILSFSLMAEPFAAHIATLSASTAHTIINSASFAGLCFFLLAVVVYVFIIDFFQFDVIIIGSLIRLMSSSYPIIVTLIILRSMRVMVRRIVEARNRLNLVRVFAIRLFAASTTKAQNDSDTDQNKSGTPKNNY